MTQHEQFFDEFQPHTRLKHTILDTYIVAWAMKLLMWGRAGDRLAIVDAFAGPGRDGAGNEGSPLIAVKRAQQAMLEATRMRPHLRPKVHVFAIEKNPNRFRQLEAELTSFAQDAPELVRSLRGELSDHIEAIRAETGTSPTFYFLDPFGIKGLDARTYSKMLAGPHNEVFALFADIGAVRLHGLVSAERADASSDIERILSQPSIFPEYDAADIEAAVAEAARSNEALDVSIPASRDHLTRALGGDTWISELEQTRPEDRADTFLRLFRDALLRAGARHVLTVPMRNDLGQRVYALVHASKSVAGVLTMKECVSAGLRRADLSDRARQAIMTDLSVDLEVLIEGLKRDLAGVTIPWAEARSGLRDLLLAHTPLFNFQLDDLKKALKDAGVLQRHARKEVCVLPPAR